MIYVFEATRSAWESINCNLLQSIHPAVLYTFTEYHGCQLLLQARYQNSQAYLPREILGKRFILFHPRVFPLTQHRHNGRSRHGDRE